jgi:tRNA threonylcarbamoyladenosine modification (KEOPS) complex  Pcc1 subunit
LIKNTKGNIKSIIKIKLTFENEEIAKSVNQSTTPENQETPDNVKAFSEVKEKAIHITVETKDSLKDLRTTVDDYLEKIDLSYKTIKSLKK